MTATVCAVVEAGGVPGRNPLVGPLRECLAGTGVALTVWDPTRGFDPSDDLPPADLYLLKGDHPLVLTAGGCVADRGGRCLNDLAATQAAADKARTHARLTAAGIPVPPSTVVAGTDQLAAALAGGARWVKPLQGAHGEGVALLDAGQEHRAAPGPWLVQQHVDGDGSVLKVYGVGKRVAVRRARTEPGRVDVDRHPVARPDPAVVDAAVAAAAAAGLVCFGADFVTGPDGPVLIDLNAFPGYRTVADAPAWVAAAVRAALEEP